MAGFDSMMASLDNEAGRQREGAERKAQNEGREQLDSGTQFQVIKEYFEDAKKQLGTLVQKHPEKTDSYLKTGLEMTRKAAKDTLGSNFTTVHLQWLQGLWVKFAMETKNVKENEARKVLGLGPAVDLGKMASAKPLEVSTASAKNQREAVTTTANLSDQAGMHLDGVKLNAKGEQLLGELNFETSKVSVAMRPARISNLRRLWGLPTSGNIDKSALEARLNELRG